MSNGSFTSAAVGCSCTTLLRFPIAASLERLSTEGFPSPLGLFAPRFPCQPRHKRLEMQDLFTRKDKMPQVKRDARDLPEFFRFSGPG